MKGDLLFTGSGETKEDIGKCVLFRIVLKKPLKHLTLMQIMWYDIGTYGIKHKKE